MTDPSLADVKAAVDALQQQVASGKPDPEIMKKVNATLDAHEEKNQALALSVQNSEKEARDFKDRIDELEGIVARKSVETGQGAGAYKQADEYKTLQVWCQDGIVDVDRKAFLRTDSDIQGGFLVPTELDNVITKKITEISAVRSVSRVRTIGSKSLEMAVRATIPVATYEGEAETGTDSNSTYENESLVTFRQTFTTGITQDMLMDSAFDMEAEITTDAQEAFAKGEGINFVTGDGVKKPAGFTADSRVQAGARNGETASTITATDILLLTGDLKTGYNPTYTLNRRTLAFLRTLKAGDGNFLWQPGLNGVVASTLAGFPYVIMEDMPDIADNAFPIAFGDFLRGYTIVDRTGMSVIRDEFTQKKKAIIEFTMNRWNYGQVTLPEAIKLLKVIP
jgi:HK97 family phage major capsid protein